MTLARGRRSSETAGEPVRIQTFARSSSHRSVSWRYQRLLGLGAEESALEQRGGSLRRAWRVERSRYARYTVPPLRVSLSC